AVDERQKTRRQYESTRGQPVDDDAAVRRHEQGEGVLQRSLHPRCPQLGLEIIRVQHVSEPDEVEKRREDDRGRETDRAPHDVGPDALSCPSCGEEETENAEYRHEWV